jgi:ABC-type dipeptide/oligopeptide/nickel transport system permease component
VGRYIVRRLTLLGVVLFGVSTLIFAVLRLSGDPIALFVADTATAEEIDRVRRAMGFDEPLPVQYLRFLGQVASGDFGTSFRFNQPALGLVLQRLPATLLLTLAAIVVATAVGVPLGVVAALARGTRYDAAVMVVTFLGQSVPTFWLGIIFILLFAVELRLLPSSGGPGACPPLPCRCRVRLPRNHAERRGCVATCAHPETGDSLPGRPGSPGPAAPPRSRRARAAREPRPVGGVPAGSSALSDDVR